MKAKFRALAGAVLLAALVLVLTAANVFAQEGEPAVIDEVIAQVENDVITLSMVRREMREFIENQKQQGVPEQKATEEVTKHQPEIIASLINEQLLMQKGKELGFTEDVEAEVNRRMLDVAKQHGIKSIADLDDALKQSGIDPVGVRQALRSEIMKQMVFTREVDSKIYYGLSQDELRKYYEAHKDKFRKPESVTLSEIWLSLAGKPEAEVKAKAMQLVLQARGGADFKALAIANSERMQDGKPIAPQNGGKVGTFQVPDLRADVAAALKNVPVGGVTDPIRSDEAYMIFRVDERTAASDVSSFNENQVREAVTQERSENEHRLYLDDLRKKAFIKIATAYRESVEPLLNLNKTPEKKASNNK